MDLPIKNKKVAIYGDAFNPITNAHVRVAEIVLKETGVDEIWFMPTNQHPDKPALATATLRIALINRAIIDHPKLKLSTHEFRYECDGTTWKTLSSLKASYPDTDFSFIIGLDRANTIDKWYNSVELMNTNTFIVVPRLGYSPIKENDWYTKFPHIFIKNCEVLDVGASATRVRELLRNREENMETLKKELHPEVLNLILMDRAYNNIS